MFIFICLQDHPFTFKHTIPYTSKISMDDIFDCPKCGCYIYKFKMSENHYGIKQKCAINIYKTINLLNLLSFS